MRTLGDRIVMSNGLTLTMDTEGKTVNGLALLDAEGVPMGMEASVVIARQGVYENDHPAPGSFLDTDRDLVVGGALHLTVPGAEGEARRSGARIGTDAAGSFRVDVPGRADALVVDGQGLSISTALMSQAISVLVPGVTLASYDTEVLETMARGAFGPVYTSTPWTHLNSLEGTLVWDHVAGADPAVVFSADNLATAGYNADHWQLQTSRVKIAYDYPAGRLWIFGGPSGSVASSAVIDPPLATGQRHAIHFRFNAATGDVEAEVAPAGGGGAVGAVTAKVGSWPFFTPIFLFGANDNDEGANELGFTALDVKSAQAHVVVRYPMLFVPVSAAQPQTMLVPGQGGATNVAEAVSPGLGLVSQIPAESDFARWRAWVSAQINLTLAGYASSTAEYPVVGTASELTEVGAASTVQNAPFWVSFTPTTLGGAGTMRGTSWGDSKLMIDSACSRALQHMLPSLADHDYCVTNDLPALVLIRTNNDGTDANNFVGIARNGYTSLDRNNGTSAYAYATWFFSSDGVAKIHWTRTADLGGGPKQPGDLTVTSVA